MQVFRLDRSTLPAVRTTEEGYIRGEAVVTRLGVFTYANADGTLRKELRHPDDVLAADSIASLAQIPITVGHPTEMVTSKNVDSLSVGMTGDQPRIDGGHILVPLTVTGKAGLDAINRGKRELSLGYKLDLVAETGRYDGQEYTHRQRNIRYNHLAIVDQGRAGKAARLNFDGIDEVSVLTEETAVMHKVNIDGIAYDAAEEVSNFLRKETARADKAESDLAAATKRADSAEGSLTVEKARADKAEASLKGTIAVDELQAHIRARVSLESDVAKVVALDEADHKLTDRQLREKALKARFDDVDFTGKSDDYVTASFDTMLRHLDSVDEKIQQLAGTRSLPGTTRSDAAAEEAAWHKANDDLNGWRNAKQ